ncbi:5-aminolevulinate synthase [Limibacillus halophilus]|uniref:5-aminolevulinate synthase n=1 Tax=Limibacillus halophilus TaxID=1579333 RepID=A0A839SS53_9PROT|nr:5-aminolevulinate synthase [Limibacillus halophilus]MBB3064614.1 5-aminolevulinate synthase [Limibacillus halophilus]
MDYNGFFRQHINSLKTEGRYRTFADLERRAGQFPTAVQHDASGERDVVVWCSNDYLGMGQHPEVLAAMHQALERCGAGAGGTRNISGTNHYHVVLEQELSSWHEKEAALLFTSGYVANWTALSTLAARLPNCIVFSDSLNHASMIEGIRHSRAEKRIFKHNDPEDLKRTLAAAPADSAKIVAFESVYSMDGDKAPIGPLCDIAHAYGALTYLDEVHAVGLYGIAGSGVAEEQGVISKVDLIQGTLGKAVGCIGGYIAGSSALVDFVRSYGSGFIFTTALPPAIAAGATASVRFLRTHPEIRARHQERAATLKTLLNDAGLPVLPSESHIVPVLVGEAKLCKALSDILLQDYRLYVQPINYPTVPRGTERLRLTPSPLHDDAAMAALVEALQESWHRVGLELVA